MALPLYNEKESIHTNMHLCNNFNSNKYNLTYNIIKETSLGTSDKICLRKRDFVLNTPVSL
jgi:hypothetical protein